jgi:uncharacterized membrane protein YuzA (DUF378 family)
LYQNVVYFFLPLLVLVLVILTLLVLLELIESTSLLVLVGVSVAVLDWVMVGLFSLVMDTVKLVFGEPMDVTFIVIGFCWEATQARSAPRPWKNTLFFFLKIP